MGYPNVDFYTGLIYQSMGFPMTMFAVFYSLFHYFRWIAPWEEMLIDPEQENARPRQIYLGHDAATTCPSSDAPSRNPQPARRRPARLITPRRSSRNPLAQAKAPAVGMVPRRIHRPFTFNTIPTTSRQQPLTAYS